jgi:hypothetical protein
MFMHFAVGSTQFSHDKGFWDDEFYGINFTAQRETTRLIIHGAPGQANPAPLYYLLIKACKPLFQTLEKLGITKLVSYRWPSLVTLLICCGLFLYRRPQAIDGLSAFFIVGTLLYTEMGFYYASEARPYTIWMAGSFLLLIGALSLYRSKWWTLLTVILGSVSIAALFQFIALWIAMLLGGFLLQRPLYRDKRIWIPLLVGSCVAIYYALQGTPLSYGSSEWGTWDMFMLLFSTYKWVMIAACLVIEQAYADRNLERLCLYLAVLGWFLMGPIIYAAAHSKHFFFTPRQYIYWTPCTALVLVGLGQDLIRRFKSDMTTRRWATWGLGLMLFYFCTRPTHLRDSIRLVNEQVSIALNAAPRA